MDWVRLLCLCVVCPCICSTELQQSLQTIEDLKSTGFGQKFPHHGLLLLHWLASHVTIDPDDGFLLLGFNPARADYGFQRYETPLSIFPEANEMRRALPCLSESMDRAYYSVGSLGSVGARTKLPPYITQDFYNFPEDPKRDLDRIVVRVQRSSPARADKVFITQEARGEQEKIYDPERTFEISRQLLKQVQALGRNLDPEGEFDDSASDTAKLQPGDPRLALTEEDLSHHNKKAGCLKTIFGKADVRWFLTLAGYDVDARFDVHHKIWACSGGDIWKRSVDGLPTLCDGHSPVKLEVRSSLNGYARLVWKGLPKNIVRMNPELCILRSDSSLDFTALRSLEGQTSGIADTWVAVDHGLQPQLVVYKFVNEPGLLGIRYSVIWRGPQFDSSNRAIPADVSGYNASLQLYTEGGYACARLYIKKSFTDWKEEFSHSWVGFYAGGQKADGDYRYYEWVSNFLEVADEGDGKEYLVYKHKSTVSIGPGAQARFLYSDNSFSSRFLALFKQSSVVKARTVPWEGEDGEL